MSEVVAQSASASQRLLIRLQFLTNELPAADESANAKYKMPVVDLLIEPLSPSVIAVAISVITYSPSSTGLEGVETSILS